MQGNPGISFYSAPILITHNSSHIMQVQGMAYKPCVCLIVFFTQAQRRRSSSEMLQAKLMTMIAESHRYGTPAFGQRNVITVSLFSMRTSVVSRTGNSEKGLLQHTIQRTSCIVGFVSWKDCKEATVTAPVYFTN